MGASTQINLPANVRIRDVANAIGILLGAKPERMLLDQHNPFKFKDESWAVEVPVAKIEGIVTMSECARIYVDLASGNRHFLFHYEGEALKGFSAGRRHISTSSTAKNIAVFKKLADLFGGGVVFNDDEDNEEYDYIVPDRTDDHNYPIHGQSWHNLQNLIFELKPISDEELAECKPYAAYKD